MPLDRLATETDDLMHDLRVAWRGLVQHPGFALSAVLVLAVGIGANTAVFSVADGVLLRPLGYPEPERLVALWPEATVDKLIADQLRSLTGVFSATSAAVDADLTLTGDGEPATVAGARVGVDHFAVLGRPPLLGRGFAAGEERPGSEPVAVLSYGLWQGRYGGDPGILGRTVVIEGRPHAVVGVMPPGFRPLVGRRQLWVPLTIDPGAEGDYLGSFYLAAVGRLRPGVTAAAADAALAELAARLHELYPNLITEERLAGARTRSLHAQLTAAARPTLVLLLAAVGCVLLVACANVANLVLSRSLGRRQELAVRSALGARRWALVRQLLVEGVVLAAAGAAVGLLLARWGLAALASTLPADLPRRAEVAVDARVLLFSIGLAALAALLFSLWPALRASRGDLQPVLRGVGRGSAGLEARRGGQVLVVAQVTVATVLLVAAGLLLESLWQLQQVDPGFDPAGVLTLHVGPPETLYPEAEQQVAYYDRLLERLRAIPGVETAGAVQLLPLTAGNWRFPYVAEGHPVGGGNVQTALPDANFRIVTPGYFETLGIRLASGRSFTAGDRADAPAVGMINATLARSWWPEGGAVGRTIQLFGDGGPEFTVVGVVEDVRQHGLDRAPEPEIYRPYPQWPTPGMFLLLRSPLPAASLAGQARAAVWAVDPGVPIADLRPAVDVVRSSLADERFASLVVGAFSSLAFLLGMFGLYAVIGRVVAGRRREIGIRMALGERRLGVLTAVLGQGLRWTALGVVLGLGAAVGSSGLLRRYLFHVEAFDLPTFLAVAAIVVATSVASSLAPAWRASRVDPAVVLRGE